MPSTPGVHRLIPAFLVFVSVCGIARAQEPASPPAYLAVVEGAATIERDGDVQPAVRDMPFVTGDRLRTESGRVEIDFPDGTTIEVGSYSEVEALSATRVRLVSGTMDHLPRRAVQADSANYLPQDLQRYGTAFDQYGYWNNDAAYGYVWYPRVTADWRPYYYGSWSAVPSYGWTWIGLDAWSWPTHHYGRWGYARNAWFWIPGRAWSAAWVSWGIAPDYVSWCPLGFDGRPVFAFSGGLAGPGWTGWTVMPRTQFGYRGRYAHDYAVDPRRVDARTGFVQTSRLPATFGRDRQTFGDRGPAGEGRAPDAPRRSVVAPASPGGVGVAVPRGTASAPRPTTTNDRGAKNREPGTRKPEPGTSKPNGMTPDAEPRTPDRDGRRSNRYTPGVPAAGPRAHDPVVPPTATPVVPPTATPVVPPTAAPVVPPTARPVVPPVAPQKPLAPGNDQKDAYRPAPPVDRVPGRTAEPGEGARAPQRPAPVERVAPAGGATSRPAPPSPAPPPGGAPSGKAESAPTKRPR